MFRSHHHTRHHAVECQDPTQAETQSDRHLLSHNHRHGNLHSQSLRRKLLQPATGYHMAVLMGKYRISVRYSDSYSAIKSISG